MRSWVLKSEASGRCKADIIEWLRTARQLGIDIKEMVQICAGALGQNRGPLDAQSSHHGPSIGKATSRPGFRKKSDLDRAGAHVSPC